MNFQKYQTKLLVHDYISWRVTKAGYNQWHLINKIDLVKNSKTKLFYAMRQIGFEFEKYYNEQHMPITCQFEPTELNTKDTLYAIIQELFEIENKMESNENHESKISQIHHIDNLNTKELALNCNWGRVIGLFAFSGCLAVKCYEKQKPNLVYFIIDILIEFLNNDKRIYSWIQSNDSWVGFMDFFTNRSSLLNLDPADVELPVELINSNSNNFLSILTNSSCLGSLDQQNYFRTVQSKARSAFLRISQICGFAVGSIGVIVLGVVYIKK